LALAFFSCLSQTVTDAMELLEIHTEAPKMFEVNALSTYPQYLSKVDFDTLTISSFYQPNEKQNSKADFSGQQVIIAKDGIITEYWRTDRIGIVRDHDWFEGDRMVKREITFNEPEGKKLVVVYTYSKSGAMDSIIQFFDGQLHSSTKADTAKNEKRHRSKFTFKDGRILEATSRHDSCNNVFNYEGDRLISITAYSRQKSRKVLHQIWFNDHALISRMKMHFGKHFSQTDFTYEFDPHGRWITRKEKSNGDLIIDRRLFK
jgi:hypothetical protein